jgi:hypothetical protein
MFIMLHLLSDESLWVVFKVISRIRTNFAIPGDKLLVCAPPGKLLGGLDAAQS